MYDAGEGVIPFVKDMIYKYQFYLSVLWETYFTVLLAFTQVAPCTSVKLEK